MRKAPRRRRRWLVVIGLSVLLLLGTAFAVLRVKFEGEDLGDNIASVLNKKMRGRIEIGSIEWDTVSLKKVISGGWVPVTIRNVRVWDDCALSGVAGALDELRLGNPNEDCTPDDHPDPDPKSKRKPRKLLVRTDLITAEIDIHAVMFGNHDFVFRNLWVHGGEALIEQTDEPYPLHAYDRTIVSIVTAFYPRIPPGFRAGITASSAPPIFDLRDIHVSNLNLTFHMNPYVEDGRFGYVTTIRMEGVDADAGADRKNDNYLYMNGRDPLVAKFYLHLGVTAKRGTVRVFDEGPREAFRMPYPGASAEPEVWPPKGRAARYQVNLTDIKLNRLAQLPTEWARKNYIANTLELDLEAKTVPCGADAEPAQGAYLHLSGELHNWFDRPFDGAWNLALDGTNLGPTIRSCIKDNVGGDDLKGRITLTGPFVANPAIGLDLENLDFDVPLRAGEEPLRLTLAEVQGRIDMVNEQGYIDKTKALIRGGKEPGEVDLSATFGLKPLNANTNIEIVKAIDIGRFLPPSVSGPVGKFLHGRLRVKGALGVDENDPDVGFALEEFDLALGATPTQKAVRVHSGRLFTKSFGKIMIQKVMVDAGRTHALVDGWVDVKNNDQYIKILGEAPDLGVWLKRFHIDLPFTSAGGGEIIIQGPLDKPRINIATELGGVPCLEKLRIVSMEYSSDTRIAEIKKISSGGLGGELTGSGRIRAADPAKKGERPLIEVLKLDGKRLDASRLCGLKGTVKGTLDTVDVEIANTTIEKGRPVTEWLEHIKAYVHADKLTVLDDKYSSISACINRKDDKLCRARTTYLDGDDLAQCEQGKKGNGFCAVASAVRDAGGRLDATVAKLPPAKRGGPERIGGTIAVDDLPLTVLRQFTDKFDAETAGGSLSATVHLQGSPQAPLADGALLLLRSWAKGSFLGDAQLAIEPTLIGNKPAVKLHGTALAGRLGITATVGTQAPYPVQLVISGRRVEADVLFDLQKMLGISEPVQAWITGTVTVNTELAPAQPVEPVAWIELTEMRATITHRSPDGRLTPLTLSVFDSSNGERPAMSVRATPTTVELACRDEKAKGGRVECPTFVATPAGILQISGSATPKRLNLEARGQLDFRQIAPLFDNTLERLQGTAALTASITGTFEKPNYEAELRLDQVSAQPVGNDTILEAPSGLIRIANGSLGFTDVKVRVRDEQRDEAGEVNIKGAIKLDKSFKPAEWGVLIDGKIAGKMLLVAVPGAISQAAGLARIEGDLMLTGKGLRPTISGTIDFGALPPCPGKAERLEDGGECRKAGEQHRALSIIPRGVHREFVFLTGSVDIDTEINSADHRTYKIQLNQLATKIDGEGEVSGIAGRIDIRDGTLTRLEVRLDADKIPFRIPGSLDLIVTARNITIEQASEHSTPEVGGTITIVDGTYNRNFALADQIVSIGRTSAPSKPFWEEYPAIGNANLNLALEVRRFLVKNNIADIEFGGRLDISNTPRDPRLAGRISVRRGRFRIPGTRAAFEQSTGYIDFAQNQKATNPTLDVKSDAQYRDLSGQDHLITLSINGSLEELQWDLTTSTGYNKSQTLSLLVLGRNQEQLRRSLGDQSLGTVDPTSGDVSTNPSTGVTDQIVKDLAGDWVSGLIGDSLTQITGLDVLRIEVAFGSIGIRFEKKILDNVGLKVDTEQTIRGSTVNARGELTLSQNLSAQAGYLSKNFNDAAEQDIQDYTAKLVYRLFIGKP